VPGDRRPSATMPSTFVSHRSAASANRVIAVSSPCRPAIVRFCSFARTFWLAWLADRPLASTNRVKPSKSR
jgi:hypothetical protein